MAEEAKTTTTETTENQTEKTYTEKELQSYADKRVNEAMKTARSKFENEKKEAERLASMSAEERFTEELNKRQAELEEREKQVALLENKNAASALLQQKGLSISLVDLVLAETADDMKARIDILEKEFNKSVQDEIVKRLAGTTPNKSGANSTGINKEAFRKMSIKEQQNLKMTSPEVYNALVR